MPNNTEHVFLHVDGDAFFASVYQAIHPEAKGKPVIVGYERGIATALSYEAKKRGVKRGMMVSEIKRICPDCIIASSDYRIYQLFSNRMAQIVKMYTPDIELYSIDEVFADVSGCDRLHNMSYQHLAQTIKRKIELSLDVTVSIGIAPTKTLTKIASNAEKPSGCVVLTQNNTDEYLHATDVGDIWGIGYRLAARLKALGVHTAHDFVHMSEAWLRLHFNKMVVETWYELQGISMYCLSTGKKEEYKSIQKTATVTPPTRNKELLHARLSHHIETAFIKARKYNYRVQSIDIFLKTQKFTYATTTIKLHNSIEYPYLIRVEIHKAFERIYRFGTDYRATGCTLYNFESTAITQERLFNEQAGLETKLKNIYSLYEKRMISFGSDLRETRKSGHTSLFRAPQMGKVV